MTLYTRCYEGYKEVELTMWLTMCLRWSSANEGIEARQSLGASFGQMPVRRWTARGIWVYLRSSSIIYSAWRDDCNSIRVQRTNVRIFIGGP